MKTFKLKTFYNQLITDLSMKFPAKEFNFDKLWNDQLQADKEEFKKFMKKLDYIREAEKIKVDGEDDAETVVFYETL